MSNPILRSCAAIAALLLFSHVASAQAPASPVLYRLDAASSVSEGCFGPSPCACVAWTNPNLFGTMTVQYDFTDPANFDHYKIGNINWVIDDGISERRIAGRGTYKFGGQIALQSELKLQLSIDGEAFITYDGGLVPATATIPDIAGDAQFTVVVCFNRMFSVRASPVPANEILPYGLHRSGYEVGCLPPCVCPLSKSRLSGNLGLVDLGTDQYPTHLHFALVDIGWSTVPAPAPPDRTFAGFGIYTVLTATGQHKLVCDLTDGNALTQRFQSGLVDGGQNFPARIDIDMALNGFNCFDQVFLVHARP